MANAKKNKTAIKKNRRSIFEVEAAVTSNRAKAYAARSLVEENRAGILKNYTAAFMGNRQLANQNTDDVFRNRRAILSSIEPASDIEENYRESLLNEATLEFLEHRASLNSSVNGINEKMIEVNALLIEINDTIMAANEGIVKFNESQIQKNNKLLAGALAPSKATSSSNAERIKKNAAKAKVIKGISEKNTKKMDQMTSQMQKNRRKIESNAEKIMDRRESIQANAANIAQNRAKAAKMISP